MQFQISTPTKEERWKPKVRESNQSVAEDAAKLDEPSWMPRKHSACSFLRTGTILYFPDQKVNFFNSVSGFRVPGFGRAQAVSDATMQLKRPSESARATARFCPDVRDGNCNGYQLSVPAKAVLLEHLQRQHLE